MNLLLVLVSDVIHPLLRGVATPGEGKARAILSTSRLIFRALFISFHTRSSLLTFSSVYCLISFLLFPSDFSGSNGWIIGVGRGRWMIFNFSIVYVHFIFC